MARLFTAGLELGHLISAGFSTTGGTAAVATDQKRTGTYALKLAAANTSSYATRAFTGVTGRDYWIRDYVRLSALPAGTNPVLFEAVAGATFARLKVTSTGAIQLDTNLGTAVATSSAGVLAAATFARVEMRVRVNTAANDEVEVRVNGTTVIATNSSNWATVVLSGVNFGQNNVTAAGVDVWHDDIALNDNQGAYQNSWCGDGAVRRLLPAAMVQAGTGWQKPGGATTNLHTSVDNVPSAGVADTTLSGSAEAMVRNATSTSTGDMRLTMQTYTVAGVPADDNITLVTPAAVVGAASSTGSVSGSLESISNPVIAEVSFGQFHAGINAGVFTTGWVQRTGSTSYYPNVDRGTGPVIEVGKRVASTTAVLVSQVALLVESEPLPTSDHLAPVSAGVGRVKRWLHLSNSTVNQVGIDGTSVGQRYDAVCLNGATTQITLANAIRAAATAAGRTCHVGFYTELLYADDGGGDNTVFTAAECRTNGWLALEASAEIVNPWGGTAKMVDLGKAGVKEAALTRIRAQFASGVTAGLTGGGFDFVFLDDVNMYFDALGGGVPDGYTDYIDWKDRALVPTAKYLSRWLWSDGTKFVIPNLGDWTGIWQLDDVAAQTKGGVNELWSHGNPRVAWADYQIDQIYSSIRIATDNTRRYIGFSQGTTTSDTLSVRYGWALANIMGEQASTYHTSAWPVGDYGRDVEIAEHTLDLGTPVQAPQRSLRLFSRKFTKGTVFANTAGSSIALSDGSTLGALEGKFYMAEPPVLRQSAQGGGTSQTIAWPSTPLQGSLLVAYSMTRNGVAPALSSGGWTERIMRDVLPADTTYQRALAVWTKIAGASEGSVAFSAADQAVIIQEYTPPTGKEFGTPLAVSADNGAASGATSLATGSTASLDATGMIIGVGAVKISGPTPTLVWDEGLGASYSRVEIGARLLQAVWANEPVTGTQAALMTLVGSPSNSGLLAGMLAVPITVPAVAYNRSTGDVAPAADTMAGAASRPRAVADTALATDALTRVIALPRAVADAAPGADATTRAAARPRATADTAPAADAGTRTAALPRAVADVAPSADAVVRVVSRPRAVADTAPGSDTVARMAAQLRVTADVAAASDTSVRGLVAARATADVAAAADTLARSQATVRSVTDTAGAADAVTRLTVWARALADVASAADAVTRLAGRPRAVADLAPAGDAVTRLVSRPLGMADTAGAMDAMTRALVAARAMADTAPVSDALVRMGVTVRAVADAAGATDAVTRTAARVRALADTAPGTDALGGTSTRVRATSDTAPATDALLRVRAAVRAASDSAPASDAATQSRSMLRGTADTAAATDVMTRALMWPRATGDAVMGSDAVTRTRVALRAVSDTAGASDAVQRAVTAVRAVADTARAADALARAAVVLRSVADAAPVSDAVTFTTEAVVGAADAAPASDALTRGFTGARSAADSARAVDVVTRGIVVARVTADAAPAADVAARVLGLVRAVADAVAGSDAVSRRQAVAKALADSAPAADAAARSLGLVRGPADVAAASDTLGRSLVLHRALADSAPVSDATIGVRGTVFAASVRGTRRVFRAWARVVRPLGVRALRRVIRVWAGPVKQPGVRALRRIRAAWGRRTT